MFKGIGKNAVVPELKNDLSEEEAVRLERQVKRLKDITSMAVRDYPLSEVWIKTGQNYRQNWDESELKDLGAQIKNLGLLEAVQLIEQPEPDRLTIDVADGEIGKEWILKFSEAINGKLQDYSPEINHQFTHKGFRVDISIERHLNGFEVLQDLARAKDWPVKVTKGSANQKVVAGHRRTIATEEYSDLDSLGKADLWPHEAKPWEFEIGLVENLSAKATDLYSDITGIYRGVNNRYPTLKKTERIKLWAEDCNFKLSDVEKKYRIAEAFKENEKLEKLVQEGKITDVTSLQNLAIAIFADASDTLKKTLDNLLNKIAEGKVSDIRKATDAVKKHQKGNMRKSEVEKHISDSTQHQEPVEELITEVKPEVALKEAKKATSSVSRKVKSAITELKKHSAITEVDVLKQMIAELTELLMSKQVLNSVESSVQVKTTEKDNEDLEPTN